MTSANERTKRCPLCAEEIQEAAIRCKYCRSDLTETAATSSATVTNPTYTQPYQASTSAAPGRKSKVTAGILGILLGGLGVHKFYLGNIGMGILYVLFCWTYIPAIAGLIEGIIYLTMTDADFAQKYS